MATWYSQQPSQECPAATSSYWRRSTESNGLGWRILTFTHHQGISIYVYIYMQYIILCCIWIWMPLKIRWPQREIWTLSILLGSEWNFWAPKLDTPPCVCVCQKLFNQKTNAQSLSSGFWTGKCLLDSQFPSDCCITSALAVIMTFPWHATLHTLRICLHIRHGDGKCGTNSPVAKGQVVSRRRFLGRLVIDGWWLCDWKA